jgi:hypothetical protein
MLEQLDGHNAVKFEKSEAKPLLSQKDWNDFNNTMNAKKASPLNENGQLEFSDPYKKYQIGKSETGKPEIGKPFTGKPEFVKPETGKPYGDASEDKMRQIKKQKAEALDGKPGGKTSSTFDGLNPDDKGSNLKMFAPSGDNGLNKAEEQPNATVDGGGRVINNVEFALPVEESDAANGTGANDAVCTTEDPNGNDTRTEAPRDSVVNKPAIPKNGGDKVPMDEADHSAFGDGFKPLGDVARPYARPISLSAQGYTIHADGTISRGIVRSEGHK